MCAHKGVSVLSRPDLCAADKDQIRLALDPLIGLELHLVVTLDTFSQQIYGGWLAELRGRPADRVGQVRRPGRRACHRAHASRAVLGRARRPRDPESLGVDSAPRPAARRGVTDRGPAVVRAARPRGCPLGRSGPGRPGVRRSGGGGRAPQGEPPAAGAARPGNRLPAHIGRLRGLGDAGRADRGSPAPRRRVDLGDPRCRARSPRRPADARRPGRGDRAAGAALPGPRDQLSVAVDALAEALADNTRFRKAVVVLEAQRERWIGSVAS